MSVLLTTYKMLSNIKVNSIRTRNYWGS